MLVEGGTQFGVSEEQDNTERWRTLAAEARAVAQRLIDPKAIRLMLRIAEAYDGLAERAEKLLDYNKVHRK